MPLREKFVVFFLERCVASLCVRDFMTSSEIFSAQTHDISLVFQAFLELLQEEQAELAETASTMTQQQREIWLQTINNKITSLDPGIKLIPATQILTQ